MSYGALLEIKCCTAGMSNVFGCAIGNVVQLLKATYLEMRDESYKGGERYWKGVRGIGSG